MMEREEALETVQKYLKNKNLVKHSLAVEACMKALASRLNQDVEKWGLAGMLHDLDYEITEKVLNSIRLRQSKFWKNLG